MLLPAVNQSREAARRLVTNHLMQIGLALHNYGTANNMLPPGVTCSTANMTAAAANPWADVAIYHLNYISCADWLPSLQDSPKGYPVQFATCVHTKIKIHNTLASLQIDCEFYE